MTPKELAERLDNCDHLVMMDSPDDPDDDMVRTTLKADWHNTIVDALRAYDGERVPLSGLSYPFRRLRFRWSTLRYEWQYSYEAGDDTIWWPRWYWERRR